MEGETKLCTNCRRDISTANFVMHEMHCRRHIVLCEQCDEPIPRSELEQHFNDVHQKVPCELCKTEVAKEKMEDHMENTCPKKQVMCEYCELTIAKDAMESHSDYCGSRTECCDLCQQYVMLKDMTQHQLSGCTYPQTKPAPSNQTNAAQSDPFSMSYLNEFLDTDFGRVNSHLPSNLVRQQAQHGRDRPPRARNTDRPSRTDNTERPPRAGNNSNRSRTTQASRGRQATRNNKSNVNSERERDLINSFPGSSVDLPPDMDYDTMLALQLSREDMTNQEGNGNNESVGGLDANGLNYHWQHFSDNNTGIPAEQHLDREDDDMTIPCEVCNLEIPVDMYIEHSDYCRQDEETNNTTELTPSWQSRDRNNAMPMTFESQRPTIPVIDNLHQSNNVHRNHTDIHFDSEEDFCVPCEFCEDIFPSELIIQHQAVCSLNNTATPRATTPASGLSSARRRDKDKDNNQMRAAARQNNNFSTTYTTTTGYNNGAGDAGEGDSDDGPRSNFFRDESYKNSLQSASVKYGGVASQRSPDTSYRSGRRGSHNRDNEEGDGPSRTYEPARQNRSAQRARATLDDLLQDTDNNDSHGALSSQGSGSNSNNVNNHRQRGATSSSTTNKHQGATANNKSRRGRPVDARTVIREVNRTTGSTAPFARDYTRAGPSVFQNGQTSPVTRPRVSNRSSDTNTNTTNTTSSTTSRNRQRSDHVFSPELRPKPNDNRRR